jgi:hypothetical protein
VLFCRSKRNIVALSDNAPTHMLADTEIDEEHGFKDINLSNLKLVFLPANTTSVAQPLHQGIIACTKAHYRQQVVQWVIAEAEKPENAGKSLKSTNSYMHSQYTVVMLVGSGRDISDEVHERVAKAPIRRRREGHEAVHYIATSSMPLVL